MKRGGTAGRLAVVLCHAFALVAMVVVAVVAVFYERQNREMFQRSVRADVGEALDLLRMEVEGTVNAHIQLVQGLAGVLAFEPEIDQARFARLGARVIGGQDLVRVIVAAPDLVVSLVHPLAGNEAVLGLDYRTLPEQLDSVLRARDLGTPVFAGPVDLVQGGRAFVARTPVFLDADEGGGGAFWGIVSTVIEREAFFRAAGFLDADLPIAVALIGRDGRPADGEVIFGRADIMAQQPVVAEVALPTGAWRIAAVPRGGWPEPTGIWRQRALFALAALLLAMPILGLAQMLAARQRRLALFRARGAELARLSWRLDFALAASGVGVWDVDLETGELMWDARAKALYGVPDKQGLYTEDDWLAVLHPEDRERTRAQAEAALAGDGKFSSEYRVVLPGGEVRHIRDVAAVHRGKDASRLVGLIWDITADVERQEELDLRRIEAEAATVAKSQFLAAMSHEIRTPMCGVLGMLDLMLSAPLPAPQAERARIAQASARSLLQILNDILDFSKLEAAPIRLADEPVEIRRLVREVTDLMAAGAEQKGLTLSNSVTEAVPEWIVADAMRLRQILVNLVSNATKFTEAGSIAVRVDYAPGDTGGALRVEVEDTGIGIDPHLHERIFEQFVQADSSLARRSGGTGLGLAISKQLAELMGGGVSVRSVPGMGSTFGFSIRTQPAPAPSLPAETPQTASQAEMAPLNILLAEDNATNQYLINAHLRTGGHSVTTVANGADAVRAVQAGAFDVVLMDVQMPQMDGPTAARAIRALPGPVSAIPIIALTANAMAGDRESYIAAGMTDYVSKPIELAALRAALLRIRPERGREMPPSQRRAG